MACKILANDHAILKNRYLSEARVLLSVSDHSGLV